MPFSGSAPAGRRGGCGLTVALSVWGSVRTKYQTPPPKANAARATRAIPRSGTPPRGDPPTAGRGEPDIVVGVVVGARVGVRGSSAPGVFVRAGGGWGVAVRVPGSGAGITAVTMVAPRVDGRVGPVGDGRPVGDDVAIGSAGVWVGAVGVLGGGTTVGCGRRVSVGGIGVGGRGVTVDRGGGVPVGEIGVGGWGVLVGRGRAVSVGGTGVGGRGVLVGCGRAVSVGNTGDGGTGVFVGGIGDGGIGVSVGGIGDGGTGVSVGQGVLVGSTGVFVGSTGVLVGPTCACAARLGPRPANPATPTRMIIAATTNQLLLIAGPSAPRAR